MHMSPDQDINSDRHCKSGHEQGSCFYACNCNVVWGLLPHQVWMCRNSRIVNILCLFMDCSFQARIAHKGS